jgi:hypothetical protein
MTASPTESLVNEPISSADLPPILQPAVLYPEDVHDQKEPRAWIGCQIEELRGQYRSQHERKRAPLTVACLSFNPQAFDEHLRRTLAHQDVECEFLLEDNRDNHTALARYYNQVIDSAQNDLILFCHPDVEFSPWGLSAMIKTFNEVGDCGALGLVGMSLQRLGIFGDRRRLPREVSTLDACLLMIDRRQGFRFDEEIFNSFHCVVEDYCLQVQGQGLKTYVAPGVTVGHFSSTTLENRRRTEGWINECFHYISRLESKWPGVPFCTTCGTDTNSRRVRDAYQQLYCRLQSLQNSRTLRVGEIIVFPAKALRYLARQVGAQRLLSRIRSSA